MIPTFFAVRCMQMARVLAVQVFGLATRANPARKTLTAPQLKIPTSSLNASVGGTRIRSDIAISFQGIKSGWMWEPSSWHIMKLLKSIVIQRPDGNHAVNLSYIKSGCVLRSKLITIHTCLMRTHYPAWIICSNSYLYSKTFSNTATLVLSLPTE